MSSDGAPAGEGDRASHDPKTTRLARRGARRRWRGRRPRTRVRWRCAPRAAPAATLEAPAAPLCSENGPAETLTDAPVAAGSRRSAAAREEASRRSVGLHQRRELPPRSRGDLGGRSVRDPLGSRCSLGRDHRRLGIARGSCGLARPAPGRSGSSRRRRSISARRASRIDFSGIERASLPAARRSAVSWVAQRQLLAEQRDGGLGHLGGRAPDLARPWPPAPRPWPRRSRGSPRRSRRRGPSSCPAAP